MALRFARCAIDNEDVWEIDTIIAFKPAERSQFNGLSVGLLESTAVLSTVYMWSHTPKSHRIGRHSGANRHHRQNRGQFYTHRNPHFILGQRTKQ